MTRMITFGKRTLLGVTLLMVAGFGVMWLHPVHNHVLVQSIPFELIQHNRENVVLYPSYTRLDMNHSLNGSRMEPIGLNTSSIDLTEPPNPIASVVNSTKSSGLILQTATHSDPLYGHTLTLTLRLAAIPKLLKFFLCSCLQSAAVFWSPKLGSVGLIMDEESQRDHDFETTLRRVEHKLNLKFNVWYEPLPKNLNILKVAFRSPEYNRQLWSSYFMDSYINTSIIAWTDTDTTFTTPVTPENIFSHNGTKLRVKGMSTWVNYWVTHWARSAQQAIGREMPADFMTYFPVYMWTDTVTNCRNHILKHMKKTNFEDAFYEFYKPYHTSPVNTIMSYAYHFEHDRYDWHIDVGNEPLNKYNQKHMRAGNGIKVSDTTPDLHVTVHTKHYVSKVSPLKQGYCVAKQHVDKLPSDCKQFENMTNFQLFEFCNKVKQDHVDTWCKGNGRALCVNLIETHYRNVDKYYKMGWYDLDARHANAVVDAALQFNITCPRDL